ncbi:MAG TPA: hypothetical protein H9870_05065, partial [Candidatus Corynebacterium avicola]|nr:hypothetical protein [Candidatus Corynebacterium avicola]
EVEENEHGVSCVSVALTRPNRAPVAISVTGPAERMTDQRRAELGTFLRHELEHRVPPGFQLTPATDTPDAPDSPDTGGHQ